MTATRRTPAKKSAARKSAAKRPGAKTMAAKRTAAKKSPSRRRKPTRRPQPALSTTIGSAIGAFLVTTLLDLSWPVRIALIVGVLVVGLGYVVRTSRTAIAAEASGISSGAEGSGEAEGRDQPNGTAVPPADHA